MQTATGVMLSAIEATMLEEGADREQINGARDLAREILDRIVHQPAGQLGFQLLPEASLTTYAFDMDLPVGRAKIYSREEPSPFGGPPLALAGELSAALLDDRLDQVTIRWKESFAPDAVESFMKAFAEIIEERIPVDHREKMLAQLQETARGMTIDRRGELVVDLADGMTLHGSVRKETVLGDTRRVDLMNIRRHP